MTPLQREERVRIHPLVPQSQRLAMRGVKPPCTCDVNLCEYLASSAASSCLVGMRCYWVCVHEIAGSPTELTAAVMAEMDPPQPQNQVGQRGSEVAHRRCCIQSVYDRGLQ